MKPPAAFLAALALGAIMAGAPLPALAQQAGKVFRIGVLSRAARPDAATFDAFPKGPGRPRLHRRPKRRIEYRLAAWDYSRLPAMAGELVRLPVDVIVTDTQKSALIAHEATRTIPIVGATLGADPVAAGLAARLRIPATTLLALLGLESSSAASGCRSSKRPLRRSRASRRCGALRCLRRCAAPPRRPPGPSA